MLHVLHYTRDFPPTAASGLSVLVERATRALLPGITSTVLSFDAWRPRGGDVPAPGAPPVEEHPREGVRVVRLRTARDHDSLAESWPTRPADVVQVHDPLLYSAARSVADRHGLPLVYTVHTLHAHQNVLRELDHTLSAHAEAKAMRAATCIHVLSEACAGRVLEYHPFVSPRLRLAPAGVDRPLLAPSRDPGDLVFVGRFSDLKGIDTLLHALGPLWQGHPEARLTLIGGLPENANAERRWRRRLLAIAESWPGTRMTFLGWQDADTVRARLARAAGVIAPSRFETFGQVAIETLAAQVPLVASRTGRVVDLAPLLSGRASLVTPDDQPELTRAIADLLDRGGARSDVLTEPLLDAIAWERRITDWAHLLRDVATT
ncbi:MAG: glycosyltransferase [Deltaproteobacteria bacterium]|nr:MAG: glycosyltransferase [Deltaproteobacteria bacterium]